MGLRNRTQFLDEECFFVTTTCHDWLPIFTAPAYFRVLIDSLIFVAKKYEADYLGYILMPNHLHLLIYFKKKNQLSNLMRDFKKFTSGEIRRLIEAEGRLELLDQLRFEKRDQKFKLWQDRFDDVFIKSREMAATKIEYMHLNPLQAHWNLALRPEDYPYSSANYYETGSDGALPVVHYMDYF
jgi:putative transposase